MRKASEDKDLEDAERRAAAQEDVEEAVTQTEADIQEAMQETSAAPARPAQPQGTNHSAFIRNLVFELTEEHLQKAFAKYGTVTNAHVARDPRGMSKGYGFVSFESAAELQAACDNVNGSFWHGRRITCVPRNTERSGGRDKHRNSPNEPTPQLFIGNIPYETTDAELNRLFHGLGNLRDVRVAVDRTTGWPRGFAHADFASVEAAVAAKKMLEGAKLNERLLRVDFAQGYTRGGRGSGDRNASRDSSRNFSRDSDPESDY